AALCAAGFFPRVAEQAAAARAMDAALEAAPCVSALPHRYLAAVGARRTARQGWRGATRARAAVSRRGALGLASFALGRQEGVGLERDRLACRRDRGRRSGFHVGNP